MLSKSNFSFPVPEDDIADLQRISHSQTYREGQVIFAMDDQNDFEVLVTSGMAKLVKTLPDGRQQIVGLLFPGDLFNSLGETRSYSYAEAVCDLEISFFPLQQFRQKMAQHPVFLEGFLAQASGELEIYREWMLLLGQKTALEKVATFLVTLSERIGKKVAYPDSPSGYATTCHIPLSRTDLGCFLGLTSETVSRQLAVLKAHKFIHMSDKKTIWLIDEAELREAASMPMEDRHEMAKRHETT